MRLEPDMRKMLRSFAELLLSRVQGGNALDAWEEGKHKRDKIGRFAHENNESGESPNSSLTTGNKGAKVSTRKARGVSVSKQELRQLTSHIMQYLPRDQRGSGIVDVSMGGMEYMVEIDDNYGIVRVISRKTQRMKHK